MLEVLVVRDLQKRFGSQVALAGVSFALRKGDWLALLGPNGAGRTTTVCAVAGRVRPDGGEISLLGERLGGATNGSARARLGVAPQEIALYPLLAVRENLAVFGEWNGVAAGRLESVRRGKSGLESLCNPAASGAGRAGLPASVGLASAGGVRTRAGGDAQTGRVDIIAAPRNARARVTRRMAICTTC